MNWSKWFKWFGLYLLVAVAMLGAGFGIQAATGLNPLVTLWGRTVIGLACAGLIAWCFRGLVLWVKGYAGRFSKFLQLSLVTAMFLPGIGGVYLAIMGRSPADSDFGPMAVGVWVLVWAFVACLEAARWLLGRGGGVLGVARTVLDEAIRMKVALVLIGMTLLTIPILPYLFAGEPPLRYRIQTFLTYSLTISGVLLSFMTVFIACATLSWEIEDKQIFTVDVKPIRRGAYLLGKWIGVVVLNAILLGIGSLAIYGFTVFYLAKLPPKDFYDSVALSQEVLTARRSSRPRPAMTFPEMARQRLAQIAKEEPESIEKMGRQVATDIGLPDAPRQQLMEFGSAAMMAQLTEQFEKEWRILKPGQAQRYIFEGLEGVAEKTRLKKKVGDQEVPLIQLLYKVDASTNIPDEKAFVGVRLNGRDLLNPDRSPISLVTSGAQVIPLPAAVIDPQGRLIVDILNPLWEDPSRNTTLTFSSREGMEVLYNSGSFGPNFFRGVLATWVKLGFLAMLGLMAATFLGFSVAVVLALLIMVCAISTPYLLDSLGMFGNNPQQLADYFAWFLKQIGKVLVLLLNKFSAFRTNELVVDGREFSWARLGQCALWIGLIWTGLTGVIAWLIYRKRELARVQV